MRQFAVVASLAATLCGCASTAVDDSKAFWDRIRQVQVGMTSDQVSALVGPPKSTSFVANVERRTYGYTALNGQYNWVTIPLRDGKVIGVPQQTPEGTIR